jgi:hypothetical protein
VSLLHVLDLALDVRMHFHAQGITPCLRALASFGAEGASITDRDKRAFGNTCSAFSSDVHTVNRIHSFFLFFSLRGFFPLLSVVPSARPLLQELAERHVTKNLSGGFS